MTPPDTNRNHRWIFLLVAIGLSLNTVMGYLSTLNSPYNFDDGLVVLTNPLIRDLGNFFQTQMIHYRHLFYLSFAFNFYFGENDPFGYHLFNIAVHVLTSLLVFALAWWTVDRGFGWGKSAALRVSCFTALVFAFSPLQTEAVSYISGRTSSMMALFYILSVLAFAKAGLRNTSVVATIGWYALCLIAFGLALLSKETAITLPASLLLYDLCFMNNERFTPFRGRLFWIYLPVILMLVGIIALSPNLQEQITMWMGRLKPGYALQQLTVIPFAAKMVLFPINQVFDYDWPYSTMSTDALRIGTSLMAVALVLFGFFKIYRRYPWIAFGLGWFLIILLPTNSFLPRMDLLSERNLYLPSFGLILILAGVAEQVGFGTRSGKATQRIVTVASIVILLCLYALLIHRNSAYATNITLWEDALKKNPGKPRIYHNLSHFYTEDKDYQKAFVMLKKLAASNATPYFRSYAHTNLGNIYALWGDMPNAERAFLRAVEIFPGMPSGQFNLGVLFATKGMDAEANAAFDRAREALKTFDRPHLLPSKVALYKSRVLFNMKRFEEAETEVRTFLKSIPKDEDGQLLLGAILEASGRRDDALGFYKSILESSHPWPATFREAVEASVARILAVNE